MNEEFLLRREKAEKISNKTNNFAEGILIVGSVAYNSEAVTNKSDLDMVVVLDFSSVDFKKFYESIEQEYEPILVKYAQEGKINTVSIVWDEQFEMGLHLWDKSAFENIINLKEDNYVFRRKDFSRNFVSTANVQTLINLRGENKEFNKNPQDINGETILQFPIYREDKTNFYPGIQFNNLILAPVILSEKNNFISRGLNIFNSNLIKKLRTIYGTSSESINLYTHLPKKIKEKINEDLKYKLENFF